MPNKTKELIAQAAELQERNRLLREESARIMAVLAANKAELHAARETERALLAKLNKTPKPAPG